MIGVVPLLLLKYVQNVFVALLILELPVNIPRVQVMVRNACSVGGMLEFDCCRIDIILDNSFFDLLVDSILLSFLSSSKTSSNCKV